jgi:hypothetical protein
MTFGRVLQRTTVLAGILGLGAAWCIAQQAVSAVAPSQQLRIAKIGNPVRGEYIRTQGQTVRGIAAPYVEEYARENGIELERLGKALFPKDFPKPPAPDSAGVPISSYQYKTGDWTYFQSSTVVLYELLKVRGVDTSAPMLLVLYSRETPDAIIIDRFTAEWRLAQLTGSYRVSSDVPFETQIKHEEKGLWDMIYTDLAIEDAAPVVRILYAHTGGGGGRDQEFTFHFVLERQPPRLKLVGAKQTLDEFNSQ